MNRTCFLEHVKRGNILGIQNIGGIQVVNWLKLQWSEYKFQFIGALVTLLAYVIAFTKVQLDTFLPFGGEIALAWLPLIGVGLLDIWLIKTNRITISRWCYRLLPTRLDIPVAIGSVVVVWVLAGQFFALWYVLGMINQHFAQGK